MPELMTKQDAIEYLLYMKHDMQAKSPMDIALDTAIEALKQPAIKPEDMSDELCWEFSDGEFYPSMKEVTHWMPLPEPPEKELYHESAAKR